MRCICRNKTVRVCSTYYSLPVKAPAAIDDEKADEEEEMAAEKGSDGESSSDDDDDDDDVQIHIGEIKTTPAATAG